MLTELNIKNGNNNNAIAVFTYNNPNLICIQVDDANFANNKDCNSDQWCKDDEAEYSEDCALSIIDFNIYNTRIYPNPVKNILSISAELPIDNLMIYNVQGRLLKETKNNQIDISILPPGFYYASIIIEGNNIIKRFIKE